MATTTNDSAGDSPDQDAPKKARARADLLRGVVFYYRLFYRHLGKRLHLYAALCLVGSIAESLAITSFVPLLGLDTGKSGSESGGIEAFFKGMLEALQLPEGFTGILILIGVFGLVRITVSFLQLVLSSWLATGLLRDLRDDVCKLIEKADFRYVASQTVGYFSNLFSVEITRTVGSLNKLSAVISGMIFAATFLASAMLIDWHLTLATGSIGLLGLLVLRRPAQRIQSLSRKTSSENAEMQSLVLQFLGFFKYLKATGTAGLVRARAATKFDRLRHLSFQSLLTTEFVRVATQIALLLSIVGILYLMVEIRGLEVTSVLVVVMLFYKSLQQVLIVQEKWQVFCSVSGSVDVVAAARQALAAAAEEEPEAMANPFADAIELRKVSFCYNEKVILKEIDLRIVKNQTIGIVGESGAGKSTLVDLVTGILSPTDGTLLFDGVPYSQVNPNALRSQFGYVLQEPVVFSDTVAANISLWKERGDDGDGPVARAAKMSHAADFIAALDAGYATHVGDRGTQLSGGQRQRLAIAREFYRDTPIVIFDEATSALDSASEAAVQEGISALSGERTVIIVAHRLSTLRHCDKIFVLEAGEIVEAGAWSHLLERDGRFARMCREQGVAYNETPSDG